MLCCYIMLCNVIRCYVMLYYVVVCSVILWYVMLCYILFRIKIGGPLYIYQLNDNYIYTLNLRCIYTCTLRVLFVVYNKYKFAISMHGNNSACAYTHSDYIICLSSPRTIQLILHRNVW